MPSTYVAFDHTKPAGTQTGPQFAVSAQSNDVAAWWAIVTSGEAPGYAMSVSGGTAEQPAAFLWTNGAFQVRATNTWGVAAGATGNIASQLFEVSQDSGATWATLCTRAITYDASGNVSASTGAGGMLTWFYSLMAKVKGNVASFAAHIAGTGTAVHGLGSMSTQAASAVAITGGTGQFTIEREAAINLGATITGATAINWASGGYFTGTITGAGATLSHSNAPNGVAGYVTLLLTNPGVASSLLPGVKWSGGVTPAFTVSGKDLVTLVCADGVNVYGSFLKDVR